MSAVLPFASPGESVGGISLLLPALYDLFWSAVVLVPLALLVFKLVVPKVRTILDERAAAIQGGLERAEQVQAQADAALAQYQAQAAAGRDEAARVREAARLEGEKIIAEARAKANDEAARILAIAHQQIAADRAAAKNSLTSELGGIATTLAGKLVGEQLSDEVAQSRLIDRFLDDLETAKA